MSASIGRIQTDAGDEITLAWQSFVADINAAPDDALKVRTIADLAVVTWVPRRPRT